MEKFALLTRNAPLPVSPYVEPAALRAKLLERELRRGDHALKQDGSPSSEDNEAADIRLAVEKGPLLTRSGHS